MKNWRPITLLNTVSKIASSCIARKVKTVLPQLIHDDQKGFIKGRYIGENIRPLYDVLQYAETKQLPGPVLMVDFEKAFDSVLCTFTEKALDFFNFGPDIKQRVKAFYTNSRTCVLVNDTTPAGLI